MEAVQVLPVVAAAGRKGWEKCRHRSPDGRLAVVVVVKEKPVLPPLAK